MGVVYEAFDRERDERVALKTDPPSGRLVALPLQARVPVAGRPDASRAWCSSTSSSRRETNGSSRWSWWRVWIFSSSSARIRTCRQTTRWTGPMTPLADRSTQRDVGAGRLAGRRSRPRPPPTDADSARAPASTETTDPVQRKTWSRPIRSRPAFRDLARPILIRRRRPGLHRYLPHASRPARLGTGIRQHRARPSSRWHSVPAPEPDRPGGRRPDTTRLRAALDSWPRCSTSCMRRGGCTGTSSRRTCW